MARWNNGFLDVSDNTTRSETNKPQDAADANMPGISQFTRRALLDAAIKRSRGRFTGTPGTTYVFSEIDSEETLRRSTKLDFIEAESSKFSEGGDVKDINALGGGMPDGKSFIGRGKPSRKSIFNAELSLRFDHSSPVPRG